MSEFTDAELARIAEKLTAMERERITGWQGPGGAAYNVISEDLCESELLNDDWSLSARGLALKSYLERSANAQG